MSKTTNEWAELKLTVRGVKPIDIQKRKSGRGGQEGASLEILRGVDIEFACRAEPRAAACEEIGMFIGINADMGRDPVDTDHHQGGEATE